MALAKTAGQAGSKEQLLCSDLLVGYIGQKRQGSGNKLACPQAEGQSGPAGSREKSS